MRTNKHIDESRSDNNIFLKQRDIKEVYQEQFLKLYKNIMISKKKR